MPNNNTGRGVGKLLLLLGVAGLCFSPFFGSGCGGGGLMRNQSDPEEDEPAVEDPVPVEVTTLARGEIEAVFRLSSNLEAESSVQVFSQAKRLVLSRLVEEGDEVEQDQLLVRLQDEEQRSVLEKAKSQLAKAEREFKRQESLFEKTLTSEQAYNEAIYDYEQRKITVEDAERELTYTEVRAPIAGTVTQRMVDVGDQVQLGQHLFDIVDFDSLVARVFVPEKYLDLMRPGLTARIVIQSNQGSRYTGVVDRIAPVVDPRSGTVKVTVAVGRQGRLCPGLYVDVDLITATHPGAVLVPKRALVHDGNLAFAFLIDDDLRARKVFIEPVLSDRDFVEPNSGLEEGDRVVVAGQAGLKEGSLVAIVEGPESRRSPASDPKPGIPVEGEESGGEEEGSGYDPANQGEPVAERSP